MKKSNVLKSQVFSSTLRIHVVMKKIKNGYKVHLISGTGGKYIETNDKAEADKKFDQYLLDASSILKN